MPIIHNPITYRNLHPLALAAAKALIAARGGFTAALKR